MATGKLLASVGGINTRIPELNYDTSTDTLTTPLANLDFSGASTVDYLADSIKDTDIDFGTGSGQVSGVDIPIADLGGYFPTDDVEAALQKCGLDISTLTTGVRITKPQFGGDGYQGFNDTAAIPYRAQEMALVFCSTGGVAIANLSSGDRLRIYDGTTLTTLVAGTNFAIGGTLAATIANIEAAIEAVSNFTSVTISRTSIDPNGNLIIFIAVDGPSALTTTAYATADNGTPGNNWAGGQPTYLNDAIHDFHNLVTLPNTGTAVTFSTGAVGVDGDLTYTAYNGAGIIYHSAVTEYNEVIPGSLADITAVNAGTGLTGGGQTGSVTLSFDQTANLTSLSGDWTFISGGSIDFSTSGDDDALQIPTGAGAPGATSKNGAIYLDTTNDVLYAYGDLWIAQVNVPGAQTITGVKTFDTGGPGSAPFSVAADNTGVVTNLNADKLDGQDGSYYSPTTHMQGTDKGGTNADSTAWTGAVRVSAGTWSAGTLAVTMGGTGLSALSTGDILYASAPNTLLNLGIGSNGTYLKSNGSVPGWAAAPASPNSFETIACPSGTNPVADSPNDTLNLTSTGSTVTITGNAATETINFDLPLAQTLPASTLNYTLRGDGVSWVASANVQSTAAGALTVASLDRISAALFSIGGSTATSVSLGASAIPTDVVGNFTVFTNKFEVLRASGNTTVGGTLTQVGLATFQGGAIVNDGKSLSLGNNGDDDQISSSGAATTWTHVTGSLTIDNQAASPTYLDCGTDTSATGVYVRSNSLSNIARFLADSTIFFEIAEKDPAFQVQDVSGDIWLEIRSGPSNSMTIGNPNDDPTMYYKSQNYHYFGCTAKYTDDSTTQMVLGISTRDQLCKRTALVNNSGIAINVGETVKLVGSWGAQSGVGLSSTIDMVHAVCVTAFGAAPSSNGEVVMLGDGIVRAKSNSVMGFTAAGQLAYADTNKGVVRETEADVLVNIQALGVSMAAESGGLVYINTTPLNFTA